MEQFYFKLHPKHWVFESDSTQVFRALELADGTYLVSWKDKNKAVTELVFPREEILQAIAEQHWILLDEKITIGDEY
jgi:hypothetical protein